jgi:hypothetical protein
VVMQKEKLETPPPCYVVDWLHMQLFDADVAYSAGIAGRRGP